ncbi:MAG: tRNA nucleotidyltransferase/poly(A) polymerase family protein [Armatimonadota bacterium]
MLPRLTDQISEVEAARLEQLAALAAGLGVRAWLVGGAVRDALIGRDSLDLDITVAGDGGPLAQAVAQAWGARLVAHDRFGTYVIEADEWHVDIATARRETYPRAGALPLVEPGSLEDDLLRRDFTFNAMALPLGADLDQLCDPLNGLSDLRQGLVRGLHPATFLDDPTRIIRAARYVARFAGRLEEQTQEWLCAALAQGVLGLVTGPRLWGELSRVLPEATMPEAIGFLDCWGALEPLGLRLAEPSELRALATTEDALRPPLTLWDTAMAALGMLSGPRISEVADHFELSASERTAAEAAAKVANDPPECALAASAKNSELCECLGDEPGSGLLSLWVRHPSARGAVERFLRVRGSRADVTGDDLQAVGYAPSPGFRPALQAALRAKLDSNANREEQLAVARDTLRKWQSEHEL